MKKLETFQNRTEGHKVQPQPDHVTSFSISYQLIQAYGKLQFHYETSSRWQKSQNPDIFQTLEVFFFFAATTMQVLGKTYGYINQSLAYLISLIYECISNVQGNLKKKVTKLRSISAQSRREDEKQFKKSTT